MGLGSLSQFIGILLTDFLLKVNRKVIELQTSVIFLMEIDFSFIFQINYNLQVFLLFDTIQSNIILVFALF